MLSAIIWGLVQGLTEFLPISSSGHLVLVPAVLSAMGVEIEEPSLTATAVLHLGTLVAVLIYFRADVARLLRFDLEARRLWGLLIVGTIPALIGLPLMGWLDRFQDNPKLVGAALIGTALLLWVGSRFAAGTRTLEQARLPDAVVVGVFQALALLPGLSRSGSTIAAGSVRGLTPTEAARYSFLLGIPTIAGGGLWSLLEVSHGEGVDGSLWVGLVVAAVSGYAAIALLLAALRRVGLVPFAIYALAAGLGAILFL